MRDKPEQEEYIPESGMPKFHHVPVEKLFQDKKDFPFRPHTLRKRISAPVVKALKILECPQEAQTEFVVIPDSDDPDLGILIPRSPQLPQKALKILEYPQEEQNEFDVMSDPEDPDLGLLIPRSPRLPLLSEAGDKSVPSLKFSLSYDIQRRILAVHLRSASNLPAKDRNGSSDPFVVLHLLPDKNETYESRVVYKTLNPIFHQSFEFHQLQPDNLHQQKLIFCIYDHDRFRSNDFIGGVILPLSEDVDMLGAVYRMKIDERVEKFKPVRHECHPTKTVVLAQTAWLLQSLD